MRFERILSGLATPLQPNERPTLYQHLLGTVVWLWNHRRHSARYGVLVHLGGYILTTGRVEGKHKVYFKQGNITFTFEARRIHFLKDLHLSLLRIKDKDMKTFNMLPMKFSVTFANHVELSMEVHSVSVHFRYLNGSVSHPNRFYRDLMAIDELYELVILKSEKVDHIAMAATNPSYIECLFLNSDHGDPLFNNIGELLGLHSFHLGGLSFYIDLTDESIQNRITRRIKMWEKRKEERKEEERKEEERRKTKKRKKEEQGEGEEERKKEDEQERKRRKRSEKSLPISSHIRSISALPVEEGKAVITFMDAILDKTLCGTVALLAACGRGESGALGLAIAGDVVAGNNVHWYSIIAVTAPSPENLKTLFEFINKGFDVLEYREHEHYDVVKSADRGFKNETLRINIYKQNRQNIQYIHPHEHEKLSKVDLMFIDEAAAIPHPTLNYEGTGQSLSLKIVQQMEEQSRTGSANGGASLSGCHFRKIELTESFRYASGDPTESWRNSLLCLDASNYKPYISRLPPSDECGLYYVHRYPFLSCHKESQLFLQLMADAPAHHIFVLLGPVVKSKNQLPHILCLIQVPLKCQISRKSAMKSLNDGQQPLGDQIPPKFREPFQDTAFSSL